MEELDYDIMAVMEKLPHRYPFLLVDRIIKLIPDERILALKNVTINEPFFQGHFPENPIMPGVLIVEAMAQAGAVLAAKSLDMDFHNSLVYFMGIDKVKFRKPVTPGDQLIFEIKFLKQRRNVFKMSGTAYVDKVVVAQGELLATFGKGE